MRLVCVLLLLLLGFQCLPQSVRVKTLTVWMEQDDSDADGLEVTDDFSASDEDALSPFLITALGENSVPAPLLADSRNAFRQSQKYVLLSSRAHDIETPPPNRV